jgi:transposase
MQVFDAAKCLTALAQDSTLIVVVEMSLSSWLVAGLIPGVERQALKKLDPDPQALLALMARWREEAKAAGHAVARTVLAYEAGRDGFWLARWLRARDIEAYVMHPTSIAVSREHRRAKSDRLDTALLMRAFLGWLRGELKHCSMAAIPSMQEEDAKRPNRERQTLTEESTRLINRMKAMLIRFGIRDVDPGLAKFAKQLDGLVSPEGQGLPANSLAELKRDMARLQLLKEQLKAIDKGRAMRLAAPACEAQPEAKVKRLAGIVGLGEATADMLVSEVLSRQFKDRRALARYAGLTGSPDESGT